MRRHTRADQHSATSFLSSARAPAQRGLSLLIVLVALTVMSLAAVGLIRMVDTGALVAGNVAFKQGTTLAADSAVEGAITWLQANNTGVALNQKNEAAGYYATSVEELDVTGTSSRTTRVLIDWHDNDCAYAAENTYAKCLQPATENANNGYTTRYVITRMCKTEGEANKACAKPLPGAGNQSPKRGEIKKGDEKRFATEAGPFFRIVVRADGPRNTVSYTESYVHF
ncbi:MAG TPA: hypothetical protein VIM12_11945 [Noviherbaspirillum sp.]|jgi:Tfp pilus assembly protein PilX|uniref:pilus assembly PilX family protein n=1 Tax=Noviherbaspirillum sp. TaxID=1926288 RepID=UPI002F93FD8E